MSVSSAQALLGATSSGMMALTAIVFSIAFLYIQFTSTAYSKRFVNLLARGSVIFHAFGLSVATFVFSLGTLAFVDRASVGDWVPAVSISFSGVLLAGSVTAMALLMNQVSDLRVTRALVYMGDRVREAVASTRVSSARGPSQAEPAGEGRKVAYDGRTRVLIEFDRDALVRLAASAQATIRLTCAPGDTLYAGTSIAEVFGASPELVSQGISSALRLNKEPSFDREPRLGMRLLVDAAIMALSPAINDPTTAVEALDQIQDVLLRLGRIELDDGRVTDADGNLRLLYPAPTWNDYLSLAFDEIRQCGAESMQTLRRLRAALNALEIALEPGPKLDEVRAYALRLDEQVARLPWGDADRATAMTPDPQGLGLGRS